MRETARSAFGARLFAARKFRKMTQVQVAKKAGMSQPAYQEAETTGSGSTLVVQIAAALAVDAHWLATGEGAMLLDGEVTSPPPADAEGLRAAFTVIARAVEPCSKGQRDMLVPTFTRLAQKPEEVHEVASDAIALLLAASGSVQVRENVGTGRATAPVQLPHLEGSEPHVQAVRVSNERKK